jgi:ATP-dependent RNA helicase SUPV3L1/SUV3
MSALELPELPDYTQIKEYIEIERKTIVKVNSFADEDEYVRSTEDAVLILGFIERVHKSLHEFFVKNPTLMNVFTNDYMSFYEFVQRDNILDLVFLDDCLMPQKEAFYFGQDGSVSEEVLQVHERVLFKWMSDKERHHENTKLEIKENFSLEIKSKDLACQCISCVAEYRTKLREFVYTDCVDIIEGCEEFLHNNMDKSIQKLNDNFYDMQRELDKRFYKVRYRLKRSSLNRLESQVKDRVKATFTYPSDIAEKHIDNIYPILKEYLYKEELSEDLIEPVEYKRFYQQLSTNIWRNERYLLKEFKKLVKSIVVLKKKDVSSKILQDYLGEFWVHAGAREIKRKIIYHMGPTNSGKTYHAIEALAKAERGCYLAPLRLLAGELYDTLTKKGVKTSLLTGEEVIEVEGGTHYSSTIEMARFQEVFDSVVIDEIQMITDPQRGWAWTRALVNVYSPEIHVCGDKSAYDMVKQIADLCGDELVVNEYTRMTKLNVQPKPIIISELQKNDALIVFSRRNALRFKRDLERAGFAVSIVYGRLSPEVRREQARKFDQGETDIMVSTDAIAMGMNLPIKRVVFSTLAKFFNSKEHPITPSEIKQIAGRAGRYQRFPTGYVTCLKKVENGLAEIQDALTMELDQSEKCMVGPDLDIFNQVNNALEANNLPGLKLSEFLRLFNTMTFKKPFYCVELKEMIELAEMVEEADVRGILSTSEIFGFACAPVNLGLLEHVQYYVWILNHYVAETDIVNEKIEFDSTDIDYLETAIKCVELYQWLSRHFDNKNFNFDEQDLLANKGMAIDQLNKLLSEKIVPTCSSCGCKLPDNSKFAICEDCFKQRRFSRRGGRPGGNRGKNDKDTRGSRGNRSGRSSGRNGPPKSRSGKKLSVKRKSGSSGRKKK